MSLISRLEQDLTTRFGHLHPAADGPAGDLHELRAAVEKELGAAHADRATFVANIKAWAQAHPEPIFAVLRRLRPILSVKNFVLVTRYADAQEVLARDDTFAVTYADKFNAVTNGSNFFLGMPNSPQYTHDVSAMRLVVRREDIAGRIVPFVERKAAEIVAASNGRLDVAADLARIVPASLMADYTGIVGPDDATMAEWGAVISQYLFLAFHDDPPLAARALDASARLRALIDDAIARRKLARGTRDDVLERCLQLQDAGVPNLSDVEIRNNLLGIVVGALPTTAAAAVRAVDELLRRPDALAAAQRAALADDDATVAAYVSEAMRFNPVGPGVFRLATSDYTIASGTPRETTIPKGRTVVALLQSATFDEAEIDAPREFRIDRPRHHYMHYGYGLHTCFGQYINAEQIPRIVKAVLRCRDLRRADGPDGEMQLDGPFPSHLHVTFSA